MRRFLLVTLCAILSFATMPSAHAVGLSAAKVTGTLAGDSGGDFVSWHGTSTVTQYSETREAVTVEFTVTDDADFTCFRSLNCTNATTVAKWSSGPVSEWWIHASVGVYAAPFPWDAPHKVTQEMESCSNSGGDPCILDPHDKDLASFAYDNEHTTCAPAVAITCTVFRI